MDLNALELFVAAAGAGSLSEAARRTGVPLATVSRRVRKLEDDLGVRLVERGSQGLALTPAGTQLLAEASPALATLSQAEQRLHDASGVAGTLRVSLPPHFKPMWSVFSEFARRHPAVRMDLFIADRRVDLVADGVDIVLRVGEGGYGSYVGRTLARYRHRVVAAPSVLERVEVESPEDLRDLVCACWRTGAPPSWTLGEFQLRLDPVLVTNDYEHLLHMAVTGQAIAEVPPFMASEPLQDGRLVEVLPDYPMPVQAIRALVVDTRGLSPLVRQFLDFAAGAVPAALGRLVDGG
ncbi:MAG: DNA-binding transcriptional LysR family regulator [Myxococcota bacterium]|jgi:DNA-binding transcriptional LysR family regulator